MLNGFFYRLGKVLYYARWVAIILWLVILLCCIPFAPYLTDPFRDIGFKDSHSESSKANEYLNGTVGYSYNNFIVMYTTDQTFKNHPEYLTEIKNSLKGLKDFPIENQVMYPDSDNHQISKDGHAAYAVVFVNSNHQLSESMINTFRDLVKKPSHLTMHLGGEPIFIQDTQVQTQHDLYKNEYVATPVAIITMLVVFGTVIAGILPIILGGIAAFLILTSLYFVGQVVSLSVFTLNIALLLGAILSLDYSLLIISRFREELNKNSNARVAIGNTMVTAGKAVFFSGLAVLISLSALMLFQVDMLFSVGLGGLISVLIAMLVALILLPALLSVLGHRINFLPLSFFKRDQTVRSYWHWIIVHVMKRPWSYAIVLLIILLTLGFPFLYAKIGTSDYRILPKGVESRDVFDIMKNKFGENVLDPIYLIVEAKNGNIVNKNNISALYELVNQIKKDSRIQEVNSIVSMIPKAKKEQYVMLYSQPKSRLPQQLKDYLRISTHDRTTLVTIISKADDNSQKTKNLINDLQHLKNSNHFILRLTGTSVNEIDVKKSIMSTFPYAFLWIVGFSYLILLIFLRSIFLPIKAIITTMLSLCASYGVLVVVFQEGYLHWLLRFEKQGLLDITLLIIIFCALFGVSMDYEVFLLTRIKEYYEKTQDNVQSIMMGIEQSSRIITSAAMIVILLCLAFMSADIIIVKAFGLGIAVAVFVDAFIIRTLFVPAVMALMGDWNWYAPEWLKKILPRISFDTE